MKERFLLTNAQQNIWNLQMVNPNLAVSNLGGVAFFNAIYDFESMASTLNQIIFENDNFWLRFAVSDGMPYQYFVKPSVSDIFEEIDFSDYPIEEINRYFTERNKKVIDPKNSKLYQFIIFKYQDNKIGVFATMSHLIFDAWSFPLIIDDIINKYTAFLAGSTNNKVKLHSYKGYLESIDLEGLKKKNLKGKEYFEQLYSGGFTLSELTNWPINRENIIGDRLFFNLTDDESKLLTQFCSEQSISLAVIFEAALLIYLKRISRQDSPITIGLPTLNRKGKERDIFGMFIGMLPMTVEVPLNESFEELFKRIQHQHKLLFKYQNYSINDIREFLSTSQGYDSNMFDIMFNYQNGKSELASINNVKSRYYSNGTSEVPLVMMVNERDGESVEISYDYQINNFSEEDVQLFNNRILYIIKQIISGELDQLKDVTIVPNEEMQKINYFAEGKEKEVGNNYVTQLFEQIVGKMSDKCASKDSRTSISYGELNKKANQFANFLLDHGLKKGDRVCVNINNDINLMIIFWGILKSGGVFVPVDIEYPENRVKYILENSQSRFMISDNQAIQAKYSVKVQSFNKNDLIEEISSYSNSNVGVKLIGTDSAYILYTSGTTGKPKGVENSHAGLLNRIIWMRDCLHFTPKDRILQKTSISFDVSIWELILAHVTGAEQILADRGTVKDTDYIKNLILKEKVTCTHFVPSLLDIFLEDGRQTDLEKIICSGEKLQYATIKHTLELNKKATVYNLYGPTEAAIDVTCFKFNEDFIINNSVPIGAPIYNTTIRIVDQEMHDLPIGVAGELVIYGVQVAKGYFGNSKLTNSYFGIDSSRKGQRYYKTGDIAVWNRFGQLEFIGREDGQIKINGVRIEVGEIESQILKLESVTSVAVLDKEINGKKMLVAFYTGNEDLSSFEIRSTLLNVLPKKWIPSVFEKIEEIPLNNSGKTDLKTLRQYTINMPKSTDKTQSITSLEKTVLDIVSKTLEVKILDINSDLFAYGLDSIKSIKIISELAKIGYKIDIEKLYQYATVKNIVDHGLDSIHQEYRVKNFELLNESDLNLLFEE